MTSALRLLVVFFPSILPTINAQPPKVTLDTGSYYGITRQFATTPTDVDIFLGLPFAAPPVGPLRFASPRDPSLANRTGDQFATELPPACIQNGGSSKLPESEGGPKLIEISGSNLSRANSRSEASHRGVKVAI